MIEYDENGYRIFDKSEVLDFVNVLKRRLYSEFPNVPRGGFTVESFKDDISDDTEPTSLKIIWEGFPTESEMTKFTTSLDIPECINEIDYKSLPKKVEGTKPKIEKAKETAVKIRARLKKEFPELPAKHFSVKVDGTTWTSRVNVSCTDYPTEKDLMAIVKDYKSSSYDGMEDLHINHGYIDPETGDKIIGADYVNVSVKRSKERLDAIENYMQDNYPENFFDSKENYVKEFIKVNDSMDLNHKVNGSNLEPYDSRKNPIDKTNKNEQGINYLLEHKNQIDRFLSSGVSIRRIKIPIAILNIIGHTSDDGSNFIFNSNLDAEKFIYTRLVSRLTVDLLKDIEELTDSKENFNNEVQNILLSEFEKTALPVVETKLYQYLVKMYQKEVKSKGKQLLENHMISDNQIKEYLGYLKYAEVSVKMDDRLLYQMLELHDINEDIETSISNYIDSKSKLFTEVKNPDNKLSDDLAIEHIRSYFEVMSNDSKLRLNKIMNKNEREVVVQSGKNPYTINHTLLLSKQTSKIDKTKTFYQTPFGLWVVYEKGSKNVIQPIYRLGIDTISESVSKARQVTYKYNLDSSTIWFAEKMYLRK